MLIMNEVKDAERIIARDITGYKPAMAIGVLAKYYIKKHSKTVGEAKRLIEKCLVDNWPCINLSEWTDYIDKSIKRAKKFPLKEIEEVPVTQKEIDIINSFPVKRHQKLAFTLLVIAKFNYMVSGHEWVNNSLDEINKAAGITWKSIKDKCMDIHELYVRDLIVFPKRIDSTSIKVLYIDKDGEPVIRVKSFENVGKVWSTYNCDNYKQCVDCGKPFEVSGTSRRRKIRCDECQHKFRLKYKSEKEKMRRNS